MTLDGSAQLQVDEVRAGDAYERSRGEERRRVAETMRSRRIHLGDHLALIFENRDSIRSTLEEALRTDRIDDPERVAGEIAAFNAVVPAPGELVAVLVLEVADPADLSAAGAQLEGLEQAVWIEVAGTRVRGRPEVVSPPGESAPAHLLRFQLEPDQRAAILAGSAVAIATDHPSLAVTVPLDEEQRRAVASDL